MLRVPFLNTLVSWYTVVFRTTDRPPLSSWLRQRYRDWVWEHTVEPLRGRLLKADLDVEVEPSPKPGFTHACRVWGQEKVDPLRPMLQGALAAARVVAEATGGHILEGGSERPVAHWPAQDPLDGSLRLLDYVPALASVGPDGLAWLTTSGMGRFGLPELQMRQVPPLLLNPVSDVLRAVGESLWRTVLEQAPQSPGYLLLPERLELKEARRPVGLTYEAPDRPGFSPFLTLGPPDDEDSQAWYYALAGQTSDCLRLQAAYERARGELPSVAHRFRNGLPEGATLFVKADFPRELEGSVEQLWVAVRRWKGQQVHGTIASEPVYRTDLGWGRKVSVQRGQICDWAIEYRNGRVEGDYTEAALVGV